MLGLAPVIGLVAAVYHLAGNTQAGTDSPANRPTPDKVAEATVPVPTAATARLARSKAPAAKPVADKRHQLLLPDGTFVDALNGAVDAPPLGDYWGPFDWSPIVGVERSSAGVDWYKHADGSYSTTEMVMRSDLGRKAAMTRVAHPGPAPAATSPR